MSKIFKFKIQNIIASWFEYVSWRRKGTRFFQRILKKVNLTKTSISSLHLKPSFFDNESAIFMFYSSKYTRTLFIQLPQDINITPIQ